MYTLQKPFKPLEDRILVEIEETSSKTASGIIIPDNAKEKSQKGTILAVGPGLPNKPTVVKVGDTILYGKFSGSEIEIEGKMFLLMREADIYAIL